MSNFTIFNSRSKFESALATCSPSGEVCIICRGVLESSETDPDLVCEGPPIRLPCCNQVMGKACVFEQSNQSLPSRPLCPLCRKQWFKRRCWHKVMCRANRYLRRLTHRMMATKWVNFLISIWVICTLVVVIMTSKNMLHAVILIISTLFAWLAKRIFIRSYILTTSLPQLPQLFPGLRILARDSRIATRALLGYHHMPRRYSIPLMVFLQGSLVFMLSFEAGMAYWSIHPAGRDSTLNSWILQAVAFWGSLAFLFML